MTRPTPRYTIVSNATVNILFSPFNCWLFLVTFNCFYFPLLIPPLEEFRLSMLDCLMELE
jgi:hypothetical protein